LQVNAIASGLLLGEAMENAAQEPSSQASHAAPSDKQAAAPAQSNDDSNRYQFEIDDSESAGMHFAPEKGNVLFASAFDCWAFSYASTNGYLLVCEC
jgi:ribosome assembly protein 1